MVKMRVAVFEICSGNEKCDEIVTSFNLLLPFTGSYTPHGTSRACEDYMCVIWLKSVEWFLRYAPETKSVMDGRT
jgi:hypothetical protein